MKTLVAAALSSLLLPTLAAADHPAVDARKPAAVLADLKAGNARFLAGKPRHPHADARRVKELAGHQRPEVIVLGCSDSRVPPEILFDAGIGDLFVVRVAGNVVEEHTLGSIEYAAEHLGAPLVVVLGHHRCGAVKATAEATGPVEGHIGALVKELAPAVAEARAHPGKEGLVDDAVHRNVLLEAAALSAESPVLKRLVEEGKLVVVTAVYDVATGTVEWSE